jgi:hypothetical protein
MSTSAAVVLLPVQGANVIVPVVDDVAPPGVE